MSKNKGAKKTLAVFMAVLMVMSMWGGGITPFSLKAKALTAGTYKVEITWYLDNKRDANWSKDNYNPYTGESSFNKISNTTNNAGISLFYKKENGTDNTEYEVYWDLGYEDMGCGQVSGSGATVVNTSGAWLNTDTEGSYTLTATIPGFPTKLFACMDEAHTNVLGAGQITAYSVRSIKVNNTVIWASNGTDDSGIYLESNNKRAYITLNSDYSWSGSSNGSTSNESDPDGKANVNNVKTKNWTFPKANKIVWDTTSISNITLPSTGTSTYSRTAKFHVVDQYGVNMSTAALSSLGTPVSASVKATNYAESEPRLGKTTTLGTSDSADLYYTPSDTNSSYNVQVYAKSTLKSMELGLNQRKVTITAKAGSSVSDTKTFYINDPKYTITFDKNDDGGGAVDMNPKTAQVYYGETLATQSEIDGALAYPTSGKRDGYTWLGMFVTEKDGSDKMNIDEQVTAKKTYYAHWNEDTYTVVFLARNGKFLDAQYASYGEAVSDETAKAQLATYEKKNSDSHYKLNSEIWDKDFSNVTENLIVTAVYDVEAHNFGASQTLEANCEHGSGTVRICQDCGYEERTITDETLGGHTPSEDLTVVVEPTCETEGKGTHYCEVCGVSTDDVEILALGHIYTSKVTKEATCTETGTRVYTCTREGCTHSYEETIPVLQHTLTSTGKRNATCESSGYTTWKCEYCEFTYKEYTDDSLGHDWGEWTVTKAATNDTEGEMQRVCSRDENHIETVTIPKGGHTFSTTPTTETPATCHSTGTQTFKCTAHGDCGVSITVTTAMTAHDYITTVTDAKCEVAGSVVTKCENCSDQITVDLPALGHDWGSGTVNAGDEATCIKTGTRTYTCSRCGQIKTEEIPATGHSLVTIEATCTTDGKKVCSKCDYTEAGETAGHSFGEETELIKATCVNKGLKIQTCSKCLLSKVTEVNKADHKWADGYTVDYASTCSTVGQKSIHCTVCGEIKDDSQTEIAKKAHDMGEAETVLEATCTGKGITKTVCKNCGYTETNETNALGHEYTTTSETQATCTVDGEKVETCSKCGDVKTTVLPKTGHKYVAGTPVAATCKDAGHVTMTCACGDSYEKYTEAPALNHDWQVTSTTTHDKTVVTSKCSICGAEVTQEIAGSHKFTKGEVTTTPTCTTNGIVTVKCEVEGCEKSYTIDIGMGGHTIETRVTEPNCVNAGKAVSYCTTCKQTISEATIGAKGHSYTAKITKAATCSAKGEITYTCSECNKTYTEEIAIDENAHKYVKGGHYDATCISPAYDEYTCENGCGSSYNKYDGEASGHTYVTTTSQSGTTLTITCTCSKCSDTHTKDVSVAEGHNYSVATVTKQPTCHEKGVVTIACDKVHDGNCTATITAELDINYDAHNFNTTYNYPTCDSEGSVVTTCVNGCGYMSTANLAKLGHDWNEGKETKEATCTMDGEMTFTCNRTNCEATRTEVIAKTSHSWDNGTNHTADCTHGAYTTYKCTVCDETYDAVVNGAVANGHSWNDGEVTTAPTCTENGVNTYTCSVCGDTKTEVIAKTGHNFVAETTHDATCDTAAYTEYSCTCGKTYNKYIGTALGHKWGEWEVTTEATNTTDGLMTRTCENDPSHTEECVIPKGGHTFDTENPTVVKTATCTSEGEETYACTAHEDCGVTLTVTTAKIQHDLTTVYKEANCTTGGSVVTTCKNCSYNDTTTLPVLGHNYVKGAHVDATCTSSGYDVYTCSRCGDVKNVISEAATGHDFKEVTDSNTATCTKAGMTTYECANCETTLEVATTALGHDYSVEKETVKAKCNSVGYTVYECSRCDSTHTEYAEKLGDHTFPTDWTVVQTATDVLPGIKVKECSTCHKFEYEYTAPTGTHTYDDGAVIKEATCTEDGTRVYTCKGTDCGCTDGDRASYTVTIPATGHDKYLDFVDATCDTDGHAIVKCNNCDTVFENKIIVAKGHTYGDTPTKKQVPTCNENGYLVYKCTTCKHENTITIEKVPTAHNYTKTDEQKADCTHAGYEIYKCENCGDTYWKFISDPTAHAVDESKTQTVTATCNKAGYVKKYCACGQLMETVIAQPDETAHNWETHTKTAEGCLKSGYSYQECSVCGKIKDITVTDSADHAYTQKVKTAETCTVGGEIEIYCTTCEKVVQTVTTSPLGHNFSGEPTVTPATCEKDGSVVYSCQRTGCDEKLTYTLDKTPHNYVSTGTFNATCTDGAYELFKCSDCGALMKNTTSSANGHSYDTDPSNADVEATCCAEGHVYRKCANCDAKYDYVVPATGEHTYDNGTVIQEATCLKSEVTEYKCTTDGCTASYREVTADAKGHSYSDWTYAHMTATGKCVCGDTITVNIPESATHSWVYDKISSPATCKTKGYIQFKCDVDGCTVTLYKEYGPIADAHVWNDGETTTEATCTEDGVKTYTCTKCGITKTETIAKLGHEHTSLVEKVDPTCTANGYVTYKCIRCDDKVTSIIEKNSDNHKFVSVTVDPTCLEDGYTVETCEYCGLEGTKTIHENTALGHHEVVNETKPDCTTAGSKITYCDRCNIIIKTESSAALGHDENRTNITPATCEGTGKDHVTCSRCDYEADETVNALGHDWNDGEIIVVGNCERQQVTRYTCKRCGDTKDVLTGETAKHNYEYKGIVAPTCTEQGYDKWVCSKCGDINKRNLVDALGHDWGDWKIVKYPTETENGLQERFCQRDECGARDEQIIIYGKFYLVTFYNYDGTRLMPPAYYEYGAPAIRPRKNPVRAADTAYTYEFIGWSYSDKQIDFVSERMAIMAQYTAHERYYDVTYKNEDGSVLATVKNVGFSQIAEKYPNSTPTKASDSYYDYTFGSWSINCDMNKSEAIATATYRSTPKKYEPPEDTGSSSEENLFTRIINWIKNFFNKLFGRG